MTTQEALAYLTQVTTDYLQYLPPSARLAVAEKAQEAINQLKESVDGRGGTPPDS